MNRYSKPQIVARYVEAEWGDLLSRHSSPPECEEPLFSFGARTLPFYQRACGFLESQVGSSRRILDVGSATGRFLRELASTFADADEIVGCEPSPELHALSRSILQGSPPPEWLPTLDSPTEECDYVKVGEPFRQEVAVGIGAERIHLEQCFAEMVPRPSGYFDLVCCLNVADRHPDPEGLVSTLGRLLRVEGHLCLASPMDWKLETTPKEKTTDNLRTLLREASGWSIVAEENMPYVFRTSCRKVVSYIAQVLLAQRIR